jgi:predicted PurR-regulated permease PerM
MAFYWTLESDRAIRTLLMLFAPGRREAAREIITAIEGKLGAYLFGMGILLLTIFGLSLAAYLLIGLPNALVLALIAGLMEAVPAVGPILGAIPAVLMAASSDPSKIIWVLIATMIIQLAENNLLVPRVMDRSVGVNPLLTLLTIAALSSLMGLAGALLAVPIAAIVQLLFDWFVLAPMREPDLKLKGRGAVSYLRLKVQEVALDSRKQIIMERSDLPDDVRDDPIEEVIETLANDLDRVLARLPQTEEGQG